MESFREALGFLFQAHPWHGVPVGENAPDVVTSYVEIVPTDTVKYELDKRTGLLKIDRPQKFSNICPTVYGFVPQTLCGPKVATLCMNSTGRSSIIGDNDPLDICILTERHIPHGNILVKAVPIGGLRMIDHHEADDKIIAVLEGDAVFGGIRDLSACPAALVDRLKHYFLTYKQAPGGPRPVEIVETYGRAEAIEVIRQSRLDYESEFGDLEKALDEFGRRGIRAVLPRFMK